jgi:histidine triad (HIT) family protein
MASIFTKIIAREIPAYIIAENDLFIAFLDVFPLREGHVLVVPKNEVDKLYELPNEALGSILQFAAPICKAIEKAVACKRIGMAVIGLEVPHAHLHLVPLHQDANDINFTRPKLSVSKEQLETMQKLILQCL